MQVMVLFGATGSNIPFPHRAIYRYMMPKPLWNNSRIMTTVATRQFTQPDFDILAQHDIYLLLARIFAAHGISSPAQLENEFNFGVLQSITNI